MLDQQRRMGLKLAGGLLTLTLAGCLGSGGDGGKEADTPSGPPAGPIPYAYLQTIFTPPATGALPRASNCGAVMSDAGAGFTVAAGVVSLLPAIGPVLGALDNAAGSVLTLFGANAGTACLQSEINALSTQLNSQQAQINQINTELGLVYAEFYQQSLARANDEAGISNYGMATLFGNVQNTYNATLGALGLWVNGQAAGSLNTLGIWASGATTPQGTTQMSNSRAALTGINIKYTQDIAASMVNAPCPQVNYPNSATGPVASYACYNSVVPIPAGSSPTPALVQTFQLYAKDLQAAISANQKQSPQPNIVPLFDEYNTAVVSMFQQGVYALQLMYQIEYLANQANYWWIYNNYTSGQGNPNFASAQVSIIQAQLTLPAEIGISGVQYQFQGGSYNAQTEALRYNAAQQQLTLLYAAYMNQLYLTTLGYVYTDPLAQGQAWPAPTSVTIDGQTYSVAIDYASAVGTSLGGLLTNGPYPYQNMPGWVIAKGNPSATPPVATQAWTQNAALYQFAGLQNAGACLGNLANYVSQNGAQGSIAALTKANPGWCPTIYPAVSGQIVGGATCGPPTGSGAAQSSAFVPGSYYDGSTVIPWYVNPTTGVLSLGGGYSAASKCSVTTTSTGTTTTTTISQQASPRGMVGNIKFCATGLPQSYQSWSWYAPSGGLVDNPAGLVAGTQYLNCNVWTQAIYSPSFSDYFSNVGNGAWLNINIPYGTLNGGDKDGFCFGLQCNAQVAYFPTNWPTTNYVVPQTKVGDNVQTAGPGAYNGNPGYGFLAPCITGYDCPIYQPAMSFQHTWQNPVQTLPTGQPWNPASLQLAVVVTVGGSGSGQYSQMNIVPSPMYSAATPFSDNIIWCGAQSGTGLWNATLNCYFVDGTGVYYTVVRLTDSSGNVLNGQATWRWGWLPMP